MFTKEFKLAAVQRWSEGVRFGEVARAVEVNPNVLHRNNGNLRARVSLFAISTDLILEAARQVGLGQSRAFITFGWLRAASIPVTEFNVRNRVEDGAAV